MGAENPLKYEIVRYLRGNSILGGVDIKTDEFRLYMKLLVEHAPGKLDASIRGMSSDLRRPMRSAVRLLQDWLLANGKGLPQEEAPPRFRLSEVLHVEKPQGYISALAQLRRAMRVDPELVLDISDAAWDGVFRVASFLPGYPDRLHELRRAHQTEAITTTEFGEELSEVLGTFIEAFSVVLTSNGS